MDGLLLHSFNLECIQLLVKDLTKIHDDALVNLLPQVSTEDLDQRDLECRNFAVHENTGEVELDLKTDVDLDPTRNVIFEIKTEINLYVSEN